ncbi:MAG TPA: gamma-glutamyltransferase, partial [Arenibaculum sp.]|nr:gamma-glutamyltransferase [Arenibaculum sp.]
MGVIAAAVLATAGCNVDSGVLSAAGSGTFDLTASIAADEPRAAVVGRDVLAAGGTAADAAVAMGLAMAVTLPARAGLGGGGICLVHDPDQQPDRQDVRALDFLQRGPAGSGAAVPGTPRGLYALHAAYGRLRWERLVAPVEGLARMDRSVSRAAALDFADFEPLIAGDAEARRIFMASGPTPDEGQPLAQLDLAGTLGQIRQHGVGALHTGPLAERIARASGIPVDALRAYRPAWTGTDTAPVGNAALHFAAADGRSAAGGWRAGVGEDGDRAARVLEALRPASAEAPPTAGLAVLDGEGQAVACAFSMGGPFGTREMVPGTGIFLARPTGAAGIG